MKSMKRAFSLVEVLVSMLIVGLLGTLTTVKFWDLKEHVRFINDQKTLDALLYEAQIMTIMTDSESDVVLTKDESTSWKAYIEFSLPNHPLLCHINTKKSNTLSGIKTIQGEETGTVRMKITPPFGEPDCQSIDIVSFKGEKKECGHSLIQPLQKATKILIDEGMIRSLEKNG